MKKTILFSIILCVSFYGYSQELLGLRAGYNISNLDFDEPNTIAHSHRNNFTFGMFAEFYLSEKLTFAPELQFSGEGANNKSLRLDYVQAPIFFKYSLGNHLSIGLGPQVAVKAFKVQEDDGLEVFAFSGIGGLEYMFLDDFFIDLRYSYGFTNIFDDTVPLKAKNTNIQIGIGVKL